METLIHADIFFFVATIAMGILCIGLIVVIVFVAFILNSLHKLIETVRTEADHLVGDIDALRARSKALSWSIAFRLFKNLFRK